MIGRRRRSALYLPASNARAIEKARTLLCDVVILDLEDAVAPDAKDQARAQAVAAVAAGGFGARELVVRVNALSTPWGEADLAALAAGPPAAVLLPKIGCAADIAAYADRLGGATPLWAMIETAAAVLRLDGIAGADRLSALVVGTNDLAKELGARPGPERRPLLGFLAQTVAAARAHGIAALDGVCNRLDDPARLAAECAQAVEFGFDGKTLIHPDQIGPCNAAFAPSAEDIVAARAIEAAFARPENRASGAVRVDGEMVERLHLEQARRLLATLDN